MTKSITLAALLCLLLAAAAVTSILIRDSIPRAEFAMGPVVARSPVTNRDAKQDRLEVVRYALAPAEPATTASLSEPTREAFAYAAPTESESSRSYVAASVPEIAPKPKAPTKALVQKAYAILGDAQIATIKERLKLSPTQEYYWPAVENALRAVARKMHTGRPSAASPANAPIDPDSDEVQQLKSAALPLLFQLRDDQKEEVRKLARIMGLEKVAAAI